MQTLRSVAHDLLVETNPNIKAERTRTLASSLPAGANDDIPQVGVIPGRPQKPVLVAHIELKQRSVHTKEGRASLIHSLAHIELNAIDLALEICWRFKGMPDLFYEQWMGVAREEALHFELLRDHLASLGMEYGDLPAHNALWDMAERTKHDILARIALVPRTAEARGLDASPPIKAKLLKVGDTRGAEILDIILRDEIGHVYVGNYWFNWLCEQRSLDPVATYDELAAKYGAPRLRGPFNLEARRAAGFSEAELERLQS